MEQFNRTALLPFEEIKDQLSLASLVYNFNIDLKIKKKEDKYDLKNLDLSKLKLGKKREKMITTALEKSPNAELVDFFETSAGAQVGVTISHALKRISVIFRGSNQAIDWLHDFMICKREIEDGISVHLGFYKTLMKEGLFDKLLDSIKLLLEEYKDYSLVLSGHSLGGGMCTLFGYLISDKITNNITVISFASPRVGNEKWAKKFNNLKNIRHFRVVNQKDIVTAMPYIGFYHCGNLININNSNKLSFLAFPLCIDSSHLIKTYNPFDHLIENYYDNLECCKWSSDNKYCNSVDVLLI